MEAKEIRKFVGMEQGMRPSPPPPSNPPPFPPAVLLTDGSKGGWVDGMEGLKLCSPILEPEESVTPAKVGRREALVARVMGRVKWVHAG